MKTHLKHRISFLCFLCQLSHAVIKLKLVLMVLALPLLLQNAAAQNETLPSSSFPLPPPPPPPSKSESFSFDTKLRVNPSMAIIFVCLISAFFIMGCVSVSIRHCSEHSLDAITEDYNLGSRRRLRRAAARGLDSSVIDTFPMFLYSDVKGLKLGNGALECAVCLNEFEDDETLRLLPKCSHVFHPDCIGAWLASHFTCPVCRANLVVDPVELDDDDRGSDTHEPVNLSSNSISTQGFNNSTSQTGNVAIDIHIGSPEVINLSEPTIHTHTKKLRVNEKFPRAHSTGHSVIQPGEDCERFTLRLPEDIKNRLINSELSRAKSCVAFTRIRSSTKGYRRSESGGGGRNNSIDYERLDQVGRFDRWGFTINPPFFSRTGSTNDVINHSGEESAGNPKSLFRSGKNFKTSFERLFSSAQKEIDGERSFNRLRPDNSPV
ncbi:E3 ubiquitin-protein ligase ATL15 [Coffea arabica]|uniref:RING-type E3 ubiquitin transferase n=1 Tax=Coffea arabica TaxID=13443 RepID=A0A6P6ULS0_COFAR|nr:E3 ubiquitin-protein ligase ATL15-like [Coffea arabica]